MTENAACVCRARLAAWLAAVAAFGGWALAAGATFAESGAGTLAGTVRLDGKAPRSRPFVMASDPNCAEAAGRKVPEQTLLVGRSGGVANVFVRLEGEGLAARAAEAPAEPVVIEQRGCIYYPRMAGARVGQTLRVVNRDDFSHNVRSQSEAGSDFNIAQPFAGMEFDFELVADEPMLRLKCDMHPWMAAFVGVVPHPWFAVTGDDGRFELAGVPAGEYRLVLWHERLGSQRRDVSVAAGAVVEADFEYRPPADAGP